MKNWKFVQTGNALRVSSIDSHAENPNSEIAKELYDAYIKAGKDRNKALANLIKEMPNADKRMLENGLDKAISAFEKRTLNETPLKVGDIVEVFGKKGKVTKVVSSDVVEVFFDNSGTDYPDRTDRFYKSEVKKVGNESIDKQEWSMFHGLKKDAEKEVGNETYQHKLYPDKYVIINGKNYKIITDGKVEKTGELTDAILYGINQTYKRVSSMNSKTVNTAHSDKVEVIKKLIAGGWSVEDIYKMLKTEGYEVEKSFIERLKTGNADPSTDIRNEYNAEIHRLEKKMEELYRRGQGHSAMQVQKQIEQLQRELRELGNKKTGNKTIMDDGGRFIWGYVEKENDGFSAYTHGITGAKDYLLKAKDEATAIKELKDYCRTYWKKQGNSRMCNETAEERKFGKVMGEFKEGELKTPQGKTVTDPEQAKAIAYSESKNVNNLQRARNAMAKNSQVTLWNGNDTVLISEDGTVQYLESNSFEVGKDKYDSQQMAIEEMTKKGYRKK